MVDLMIEAKYIIVSDITMETIWLKNFIIDLGIVLIISYIIPYVKKKLRSQKKSKHNLRYFH